MSSPDPEQEFKQRTKKKGNKIGKKRVREDEDGSDEGLKHKVISASDILKRKKQGKSLTSYEIGEDMKREKDQEMSALGVAFKSSGTAATLFDSSATRVIDIDGLHDDLEILVGDAAEKLDGLYTGKANYKEFVNKKKEKITQANAGGLRAGPLKGLSGVRISSRFDYAPAICKDYKETGFCGFGDSCVFMHDRGDYKMGWQLDKEWEEQQKKDAEENDPNKYFIDDENQVENDAESDDDLPFACLICRKDFLNPVVTKCKHYFCESCALKQFGKTPACFACNANTSGVFNVAKEFKIKLAEKKKRMEAKCVEIAKANAVVEFDKEDTNEESEHDDN